MEERKNKPDRFESDIEREPEKDQDDRYPFGSKGKLGFTERKGWTFLGLPFTFTVYELYDNDIVIRNGIFTVHENDCYMYRVSDVELTRNIWQRLFGIGTVTCYTSDATTKTIVLKNIRNSREIKDFIYRSAEECKMRRRTVNMQNIGALDYMDEAGDM